MKWLSPEREKDKSAPPPAGTFATLFTGNGEATVTWHIHGTNGTEWNDDRKQRLWPAKGGWTGVLHTGPVKVKLVQN